MTTKHGDNTAPVRADFRMLTETHNSSPDAPFVKNHEALARLYPFLIFE